MIRNMVQVVLVLMTLVSPIVHTNDIDIATEAMHKAIVTQVKYETLEYSYETQVKELKQEVKGLKLEGMIKDILIVALAVIKISSN
jgi:hypothetical protein